MKTEKNLRAADLLARRFYQAGCRYAFGMPGGEVLTVVELTPLRKQASSSFHASTRIVQVLWLKAYTT